MLTIACSCFKNQLLTWGWNNNVKLKQSQLSPKIHMEETMRGSLAHGVCPWCVLAFASMTAVLTRLWNTHFGGSEGGGTHTSAAPALFQSRKISPQCTQRSRRKHWFFQAFLQCVYVILREKRTLLLTWPHCISFAFADEHNELLIWAGKHPCVAAWKPPQLPSPSSPSLLHLPKGPEAAREVEATEEVRGSATEGGRAGSLAWKRGIRRQKYEGQAERLWERKKGGGGNKKWSFLVCRFPRHFTCLCDHLLSGSGTLSTAVSCWLLNKVVGSRGLRLRGAAVAGSSSLLGEGWHADIMHSPLHCFICWELPLR